MQTHTSLSSWISAIEIALRQSPVDFKEIITAAQIPEHVVANPYLRIDVRLVAKAWDLAVARSGDENIGIKAAPYCRPAHWHALGLAMLCSNSVKEALFWSNYPATLI